MLKDIMKTQYFGKSLVLAGCLALGAAFAEEQTTTDSSGDIQKILEMLRSDDNSTKIRTLNQVLKFAPEEADKFWPVYKEYEKELSTLNDQKLSLLKDFFKNHQSGALNNASASELAEKWLKLAEGRTALWRKYHSRIAQAVSPIRAAQFLQIEHQISLFIDINIAAEVPLISVSRVDSP